MSGASNEIPGWSDESLAATAHAHAGLGSDADLPDLTRFLSSVAKRVRRRRAQDADKLDPMLPAVFLLSPIVPVSHADSGKRVPFLDNGMSAFAGRVWFVSASVVAGRYLDSSSLNDDELVSFITDDLGLPDQAAVVYDPRPANSQLRFYRRGLSHEEECEVFLVDNPSVTMEQVLSTIERVYQQCLVTPDAQSPGVKLWSKASRWYTSDAAEHTVQMQIKPGLAGAFPWCDILHEQPGVSGRLDLVVLERHPLNAGSVTIHVIIELKVLRSFGKSGSAYSPEGVKEWIASGVAQAAAYRDERNANSAALCCFDMRQVDTGDECFVHVQEMAESLRVVLRRWYIYASAEFYRIARAETEASD